MIANERVRDAIFKHMNLDSFTRMWCKKCKRMHRGKKFIDYRKPIKAVDDTDAFQVFWMCENNWHHFFKIGFTKPVDFNILKPLPEQKDTGTPGVDASEKDWEDWAMQQTDKFQLEQKAAKAYGLI